MRTARNITAGILLGLGVLVALSANVGLWVDNTIYDSDGFSTTINNTLDDPDVQEALATRFTNQLFASADIETRMREELPDGLGFLALPLTDTVQDFIYRIALRVLRSDRIIAVRERAVEEFHTVLVKVIDDEPGAVTREDGQLVINLRPILEQVVEEIGLADQASAAEDLIGGQTDDGGLLSGITLREDAGQFVIEDKAVSWAYTLAHYGQKIIAIVVGVAIGLFALSVIVATDRRSMVRNVGIALIMVGVISLVALAPMRIAAREFALNPDAGVAVVNNLSAQFRYQSFILIAVGLVGSLGAVLAGPTRAARTIRAQVRRGAEGVERESFIELVRERTAVFRLGGLIAGAVLLIAWPDPTPRVYVTLLGLIVLYLATIWAMTDDGAAAQNVRARASALWQRYFVAPERPAGAAENRTWMDWVVERSPWLRAIGIVGGIILLLVWPSPALGSVIAVVALLLAYLAAIDFIASRRTETDA